MRIRTRGQKHWTKTEITELKSLINTMTNDELCKHFNASPQSLSKICKKCHIKRDELVIREMCGRAKKGEANNNWKGGISKDHARYLTIQRKRYPAHKAARNAVYSALKKGTLTRPNHCTLCEKPCTPEGHHESYEEGKYLDVVWLCKKCHRKRHEDLPES